jgi:hypothetical protein
MGAAFGQSNGRPVFAISCLSTWFSLIAMDTDGGGAIAVAVHPARLGRIRRDRQVQTAWTLARRETSPKTNMCSTLWLVGQMAFFSAESMQPGVADLAGLLCGPGQVVSFANAAARVSVVLHEAWRRDALAAAFSERGIEPELHESEEGHPLVRTAFRMDLISLAAAWTKGAVKAVPTGLALDGASLRLWVMASGQWTDNGYLLSLDPRAPDTHEPLQHAATRIGLQTALPGARSGGPGLRLTGRRRLGRLVELVGGAPCVDAEPFWPARIPPNG